MGTKAGKNGEGKEVREREGERPTANKTKSLESGTERKKGKERESGRG